MDKKDLIENVAVDLGFVSDKYYTSKEKMWESCVGSLTVGGLK